jgi:MFS superfamily sulfate permease-like transporter
MKNIVWSDLRSGLVVFFVALPLCLGISFACGLPPESGIWSGVVGGIITTVFSGSRLSVSGPAAGLISIVISGIASVKSIDHFFLAVSLAGLFQILLRLLNLGRYTTFIPNAVIYGMLSGVGVIIILKQIPHLIGYDPDFEGNFSFFESYGSNTFASIIRAFSNLHFGPLLIGLFSLMLLVFGEQILAKMKISFFQVIPVSLLAVIIGILMVLIFNSSLPVRFHVLEDNRILLPQGSGMLRVLKPDFSGIWYGNFWKLVITMGIVATLESLLCVEALDKIDPEKQISDKNKELVAQGIGNMICGFLCALPVTSVIVRSSANVYAGAKTKLSAISHGIYLLLAVLLLNNLLSYIPKSALAAILIMVGYKLNKPELYLKIFKGGKSQYLPFMFTLIIMVLTDLLTGVIIGFVISLGFILFRTVMAPITIKHTMNNVEVYLPQYVTFFHKEKLENIRRKFKGKKIILFDENCKYVDPDCTEIIELLKDS